MVGIKFELEKNFGWKKILAGKKFWSEKHFGRKKFLVRKSFWSEILFGGKKLLIGKKNLVNNFFCQKFLSGLKDLNLLLHVDPYSD